MSSNNACDPDEVTWQIRARAYCFRGYIYAGYAWIYSCEAGGGYYYTNGRAVISESWLRLPCGVVMREKGLYRAGGTAALGLLGPVEAAHTGEGVRARRAAHVLDVEGLTAASGDGEARQSTRSRMRVSSWQLGRWSKERRRRAGSRRQELTAQGAECVHSVL